MKFRPVKIVATLGPASSSAEMIEKLAEEGVDIFRINLSHQRREDIAEIVHRIRNAEKKLDRPLTIMGDLAGPKIRVGNVEEGVVLENNQIITITEHDMLGTKNCFSLNYPGIVGQLKKDSEIYINDGVIKLRVEDEEKDGVVTARVLVGGPLKPYKSFYGQGVRLPISEISSKDQNDIKLMKDVGVDALAVSFVQSEEDVARVRIELKDADNISIIAKIETQASIENIEKILDAADGLMIARGDLGLGVPMEEVPLIQKKIIATCLKKVKPVITATQMLESMTHNPLPTRAEVTDVANAILDGTDAVMLSGETAVGDFPLQTVMMMRKIIESTASEVAVREYSEENDPAHALSASAGVIADKIGAKIIVALTKTGTIAQQISRHRHSHAIIALSTDPEILRRINFTWGVYPKLIQETTDFYHLLEQTREMVTENTIVPVEKGDKYVIVAGIPFNTSGSTNLMYVETV